MNKVTTYVIIFILSGIISSIIGIYFHNLIFITIGTSLVSSSITSYLYEDYVYKKNIKIYKKYIKKDEKILEIKQKFK